MSDQIPNANLSVQAEITLVNNGYMLKFRNSVGVHVYVAINNEELCEILFGCLPPEWSVKNEKEINNGKDNGKTNPAKT